MRTIFVTGADKGLGYCLAETFAKEGFRVFAGHLGDGAALKDLAVKCEGRVVPIAQDVGDLQSVKASAEAVAKLAEHLDILINSAGICLDAHKHIADIDLSTGACERMMAVNALGPLRVTQAFLGLLERGEMKRVATISSEAGSIGENWREAGYGYCMSKAACNMFSQILQRALRPKGFKVLIFHPGWMRTDMGGPKAHIAPETAAEGICRLILREWSLDDPMYMDYTGRVFQW